eukprot:TRINITY_DN106233_c0_g1_i1.p2 TRINITY_DN106233_c0_g1~~TRINITY_DN106233_c0_g1_i1.p2  ORF type:complete len:251 (-),score=59.67 TRINITY_DN106233_c0_g1_i1:173-925(-)
MAMPSDKMMMAAALQFPDGLGRSFPGQVVFREVRATPGTIKVTINNVPYRLYGNKMWLQLQFGPGLMIFDNVAGQTVPFGPDGSVQLKNRRKYILFRPKMAPYTPAFHPHVAVQQQQLLGAQQGAAAALMVQQQQQPHPQQQPPTATSDDSGEPPAKKQCTTATPPNLGNQQMSANLVGVGGLPLAAQGLGPTDPNVGVPAQQLVQPTTTTTATNQVLQQVQQPNLVPQQQIASNELGAAQPQTGAQYQM